jgi:hypothetical protein
MTSVIYNGCVRLVDDLGDRKKALGISAASGKKGGSVLMELFNKLSHLQNEITGHNKKLESSRGTMNSILDGSFGSQDVSVERIGQMSNQISEMAADLARISELIDEDGLKKTKAEVTSKNAALDNKSAHNTSIVIAKEWETLLKVIGLSSVMLAIPRVFINASEEQLIANLDTINNESFKPIKNWTLGKLMTRKTGYLSIEDTKELHSDTQKVLNSGNQESIIDVKTR